MAAEAGTKEEKGRREKLSIEDIKIDPAFKNLIPPLSSRERAELETSILKDGCRDPLVVWKGKNILLDGHNRFEICKEHGITCKFREEDFPDEEAARAYIVQNQLGRRNLTAEAASYLRGKRYEAEKKAHGGKHASNGSSAQSEQMTTAEKLGKEHKVGQATIRRDHKFALAVDKIVDNCGEDTKNLILSRDTGLSRGGIVRLVKLPAAQQRKFIEDLKASGKPPRKQRKTGKPTTITLSTRPKEFAKTLLKRLSREEAKALAKALAEALEAAEE